MRTEPITAWQSRTYSLELLDPRRQSLVVRHQRHYHTDQLGTRQTVDRLGRQPRSGSRTSRDGRTSHDGPTRCPKVYRIRIRRRRWWTLLNVYYP